MKAFLSHLKSQICVDYATVKFCLVLDVETCGQDLARLMLVSVEDQRDSSSPLSADSPSPSPVFLPSPQHHSSSSSACSLSSSSSGSDIVRPADVLTIQTFTESVNQWFTTSVERQVLNYCLVFFLYSKRSSLQPC